MNPINLSKFIEIFSKFNLLENGYNLFNTLTYSIIGVLVYFFIVYPYLLFRKVKINLNFIISVLIFVFIGAILRMFSLEYTSLGGIIIPSNNPLSIGFYFYYPNLFLFLTLLFLIIFELSRFLSKSFNFNFEKTQIIFSLVILVPLLLIFLINILNWNYFFRIIFFSSFIFLIIYFIFLILKFKLLKNIVNSLALFSQVFDSFTTFFSVMFMPLNFIEKHIFSNLIISISPYLFLLIKILFCIFLLYLIDYYIKEVNLNNYFKLFIIIIGFTTALRNLVLISLVFI